MSYLQIHQSIPDMGRYINDWARGDPQAVDEEQAELRRAERVSWCKAEVGVTATKRVVKRRDWLEGRGMRARKKANGMITVKPMLQGVSDGHTIQVIDTIKLSQLYY